MMLQGTVHLSEITIGQKGTVNGLTHGKYICTNMMVLNFIFSKASLRLVREAAKKVNLFSGPVTRLSGHIFVWDFL